MSSQDIFELQDDGFDGSKDELSIAQEVFYGNIAGSNSKRCASNGVASSASEPEKVADILPSTNSENSALTNQASSEDLSHKDSDHVDLSMKTSVEDEEIDHNVHTKRIKLSVNELCSFKPYLDNATSSSIPMKKVVYGMYHPEHHSSGHILMCHVVESSSDGLTSSCYLLNKDLKSNIEGNLGDRVGINGSLSCSDGSEVKQIDACKSIASPISQESSVTKLLVSNMSKKRSTIDTCPLAEDDNVKLTGKGMKHLSTVLRSRLYQLLKSEGWSPENQIRNDGRNRYIYRSPRGKSFRALARVWYLVGNTLFSHNNSKMVVDDKQWTDITKFCSDLYDTLKYIENKKDDWKSRCALTCMWRLLDPFVNVVLVNRKIIALRTGNLVKTRNSNELNVDSEVEVDCKLNSENCGADSETQKVKSIYVSEGNSMLLVKTIDEDGNNCLGTYTDRNMDVNSNHISADVSDIACRGYSGSLCDIPLENADNNMLNQNGFCLEETNSDIKSELNLKKETVEKSDKFLEFQLCELCRAGDALLRDGWTHQSTLAEVQDWSVGHTRREKKSYKKSKVKKPRPMNDNSSNNNNNNDNNSNSNDNNNSNGFCLEEPNSEINAKACKKGKRPKKGDVVKRLSKACQLKDDDLLVSAVIKKRGSKLGKKKIGPKLKKFKSKSSKKRKSKKGGCRLRLRGVGKGDNKFTERWTLMSERTVLSWLISTGAISVNESIQYREPKDDAVAKDGLISSEGILCRCCNEVLSISQFKVHAGFNQNRPCLNLFTGSGRPFTLSLLEAWSAEYKIRKSSTLRVTVDEFDKNDDSCGICGDVGELLCCDHCPSTFHQSCLSEEEIPEGSWYCPNCICQVCGQLADDKESLGSYVALRCSQCEKKYHQVCLAEKDMDRDGGAIWFCGVSCEEVHTGLQSRIGLSNQIGDNHTWTLLRCIYDDQKVSSAQRFALKAECNSKLAVAATIMEECFLSMIDPRTGIDMIPQVVYNWGSEFARLDYHGFYTAVLEKNDILISVASIRVHGVAVAEMPLIATCGKYRRQGMCRRLLTSIEKMLTSLKVEMLVIAAIYDLVETWTVGFGFEPMNEEEKRSLNKLNLMVFPGTIMLKKTLFVNPNVQRDDSGAEPHSLELRVNEDCIEHVENQDNYLLVTEEQNIVETSQGIKPDSLELNVHEDHIQHLVENQDNYLQVTEEQHIAETSEEIKPDSLHLKVNEDSIQPVVDDEDYLQIIEEQNIAETSHEIKPDSLHLKVNEDGIQPVVDDQDYLQITEEQNIAETSQGIESDSLELKVNQDCSQENQDDCLQVTETPRCMDKTCPSNHIPGNCLDEFAVRTNEICSENPSVVTKVIEAPEGRKCVEGQFVEPGCTGDESNKSISLELVVNPVKASEGIQKGGESKMRGILTSSVGTIKEEGKGNESMTMWDYWEECIGELEPLDSVLKLSDDCCRYGEPIVVKERISGGEPQCVKVAEKQLSLNESQDGNALP